MRDPNRQLLVASAFAFAFATASLLIGCAAENGKPGPPGTAECMQCHTDDFKAADFLLPKETQFAVSKHNTGDTFVRRGSTNSPACSGCHTTEGYQQRIENGAPGPVSESSRIGCFACHAPHTNRNFTLRKQGPTTIALGAVYDKQNSNTCAMCHQARTPNPEVAHTDSLIKSNRWGPHHSTQANALIGNGAYQFANAPAYPTDHPHNTNIPDGCVHCHMAPIPPDALAGGHTFSITYEAEGGVERFNSLPCVSCHASWTTDQTATSVVQSFQDQFAASMDSLKTLLVAKGWVDANTDLINVANAPTAEADRGALFNYYYLEGDFGQGVHNPPYETAVLRATIDYLSTLL